MSAVWCRCPNTGRKIETSIDSTSEMLVKMRKMRMVLSIWCPHCRAGHKIEAIDAAVAEKPAVLETAVPRKLEPAA